MHKVISGMVSIMLFTFFAIFVLAFVMVSTVATPDAVVKTVRQKVIDDFNAKLLADLKKEQNNGKENRQ